ncbi:MAG: phosphotransferase, partial [Alloprevotella sp.]
LGAYGLRGYFERKKYFLDSIPSAIQSLRRQLLDGVCAPYPYLQQTLQELVDLPQFNTPGQAGEQPCGKGLEEHKSLVVRVFSFSYKKGIPQDESGNGGGYVFDCRSTHNPGRYEPYKKLTGRDEAVIKFLEDDGEIIVFLDSVYRLADAHVSRYLQRGFTDLMFSFGCTGGQHRSVYSAEHLAEHLNKKFGIEVRLCHREQGISRVLPAAGE